MSPFSSFRLARQVDIDYLTSVGCLYANNPVTVVRAKSSMLLQELAD